MYPPILVGRNNGSGERVYFVEDGETADTLEINSASNHTAIKFTRIGRYQVPAETESFRIVDGEFTGYRTIRKNQDPTKIIRRVDFTVKFTGLIVDRPQ